MAQRNCQANGTDGVNNIDSIEKALGNSPQQRIISAWIEGDYAHGLAAKDNKPSLCVITMPQPWEILLGEARTTQNMRDLDIRILTPLSYIDGLLDGHRIVDIANRMLSAGRRLHSRHRAFRPSVDHQQCRQDGFG